MRRSNALLALALVALPSLGCGDASTGGTGAPLPTSSAPSKARASSTASSAASAPGAVGSAAPSPSASAVAEKGEATIVGGYAGPFDAKKKKMKLPPGASEPFWGLDKGKVNVGPGEVKLSVWSDGRVTGTVTGPLGEMSVEGQSEEKALTGTLTPKEPGGFRGMISGKIEGGKFVGKLEASSRDVTIVREAVLTLDKT